VALSPSGVGTAYLYDSQVSGSGGYTDIIDTFPPSVNEPIIFEPNPSLSAGQLSLWIIVTGPTEDWGGCQIWASVDGGTSYGQLGTMMTGGVQGMLSANFLAGSDPDTTNVLSVDTGMCDGVIDAASAGDADVGITLAYVDGELVGYSNVVLTAPSMYDLDTYLRRGMFDTAISAHPIGGQFGLVGGQIFSHTYPSIMIGTMVSFKFPSFNSVGGNLEDISMLPVYNYTLTGSGLARGLWVTPFSVGGLITDLVLDPWDSNYQIFDAEFPWTVNFDANLAKSPLPGCQIAPLLDAVFNLQLIDVAGVGTPVGSMTIHAGSTSGSWTCGSFNVTQGQRLRMYAHSGFDGTIAGLYGTIVGARN
jgi:hypothetical protein